MDGSATRRGTRTTHLSLRRRHHAAQGGRASPGASARAWPSWSATSPSSTPISSCAARRRPAWAVWNELRIELNIGQYLDILGTVRGERSLVTAERIARYKTGKYTVERPLHLGAVLAAPDRAVALVALAVGLRPARSARPSSSATTCSARSATTTMTGKPVGDDLREGKPTPLLALATARADRRAGRGAGPRRAPRPDRGRRRARSRRSSSTRARWPSSSGHRPTWRQQALAAARRAPTSPTTPARP